MKKIKYLMFFTLTLIYNSTFADGWIFTWISWVTWSWASQADVAKLRNWNFTIDDVPKVIMIVTQYLMWIAWTISVIFIILWAYQMMVWSLNWEKAKWKNTVGLAASWFVLSALSLVILKTIIDNFAL
mgnify:CR=1 FL=1